MNGTFVGVLLKDQDTRALGIVGVLFDHHGRGKPRDHIRSQYTVVAQLVITMIGNLDIVVSGQLPDPIE
jgi:hypothetical protein